MVFTISTSEFKPETIAQSIFIIYLRAKSTWKSEHSCCTYNIYFRFNMSCENDKVGSRWLPSLADCCQCAMSSGIFEHHVRQSTITIGSNRSECIIFERCLQLFARCSLIRCLRSPKCVPMEAQRFMICDEMRTTRPWAKLNEKCKQVC